MTSARKRLGAWYTPDDLVSMVVDRVVTPEFVRTRAGTGRSLGVLDPACGDGRFLAAVVHAGPCRGRRVRTVGVDIDPAAVRAARDNVAGRRHSSTRTR